MARTAARLKTPAQAYVPQSQDAAAADVRKLGDLQRQLLRANAEMNDAIAAITHTWQPRLDALTEQIKTLQGGVHAWCEAHRAQLTRDGRVKTASLVTGEVAWRQRPPSCTVRGAEAVIDTLKRLGLDRFVRVVETVNKEAILNEPDAVRGVAGITVVTGVEDFVITPFEQEG